MTVKAEFEINYSSDQELTHDRDPHQKHCVGGIAKSQEIVAAPVTKQHPEADEKSARAENSNTSCKKGPRGGVAVPFPAKLHDVLNIYDYSKIISWQPHGRCFLVHKPQEFLQIVMPTHFRQTKLTSFQRQLNLYGFSRILSGPDKGAYYHKLFLRGKRNLCDRMYRVRIKGTGGRVPACSGNDPNFYTMPFLGTSDADYDDEDSLSIESVRVTDMVNEYIFEPSGTNSEQLNSVSSFASLDSGNSIHDHIVGFHALYTENYSITPDRFNYPIKRMCTPVSPTNTFPSTNLNVNSKESYKSETPSQVLSTPPISKNNISSYCNSSESLSSQTWTFNGNYSSKMPSQDDIVIFEGKSFHYIDSLRLSHDDSNIDVPRQRKRSVTFDGDDDFQGDKMDFVLSNLLPSPINLYPWDEYNFIEDSDCQLSVSPLT